MRYRVKYVSYSHTIILHVMYNYVKLFLKLKYIYEFIHQRYNTTTLCLPIEGTVAEAKAPEAQLSILLQSIRFDDCHA